MKVWVVAVFNAGSPMVVDSLWRSQAQAWRRAVALVQGHTAGAVQVTRAGSWIYDVPEISNEARRQLAALDDRT